MAIPTKKLLNARTRMITGVALLLLSTWGPYMLRYHTGIVDQYLVPILFLASATFCVGAFMIAWGVVSAAEASDE